MDSDLWPLLAKLADSRDLPALWCGADALLQAIVPHRSAVGWCGLSVALLGEDAALRRAQALQALKSGVDEAQATPRPVPEAFMVHASEHALTGATLLDVAGAQPPWRVCALSPQDLRRDRRHYETFLQPQGWEHALVLPLSEREGVLHAGLVIYRTQQEGRFDDAQLDRVRELQPMLASLASRILDREAQHATQSEILGLLSGLPIGLLLFDWDWRPVFVNDEGYRQTQLWNHAPALPPRGEARIDFHLPTPLRAAGDRLRARWVQDALGMTTAKGELSERVAHPLRRDMKATVAIARSQDDRKRPPGLLVRYSGLATRVEPGFQPTPSQLSILAQLTPGERNVALLVMRGLSNQEVAQALSRDITTVKDHLSHIYDKLGIRGRTQLAALLAG